MANEYRLKSDGSIKTKEELIAANRNMSMPKVWGEGVHEALGIDVVFETSKPTSSESYKHYVRDGVEQDENDKWVQKWKEQDMFADTTAIVDDEEVVTTKAKHEEAYQAILDADAAKAIRADRNNLLAATDWLGMSDVTMSTEWATYRQALRDVPGQSGFPNSITWPDEP